MTINKADPITTEVVRNFLFACAQDMNAALYRSAFSSVIYEGRDSAVGLFDRNGDMLGQSTGVPIFIGNMEVCVKLIIETYKDHGLSAGDVIILNDPYFQGTHMHDMTVIGPIFYKEELVGFAASRAHWQDIGTIDVGTTMGSTSIYQEGLRFGPTRIVKKYQPVKEWYELIKRNVRLAEAMIGDLNAQIAAIRTGERRFERMLDRIGIDVFESAKQNIFKQTDTLDRAAIKRIPDGKFSASGYMDNDGYGQDPIKVCVTLQIQGEKMIVDLAGSSGPVKGSMNCGKSQTISMIRLAYKTMINETTAITGGSFPTLKVIVPEDCIFNAREPAACEWYFSGLGLLADLLITCLGKALPEKAIAANYGDSMVTGFSGVKQKEGSWMVLEPTAGGWGAYQNNDGESALINLSNGAFKNIPAEVYETKFPVRIEEFALRKDSCGPGQWRGGCGVVRSYRTLEDCDLSLWFERSLTPAWGICGGGDGAPPRIKVTGPGFESEKLKMKSTPVPADTLVVTMTGGGGGYGDPVKRDPEAVSSDVREGFVSMESARDIYRVVLDPKNFDVNTGETSQLRSRV